MTTLTYSEQRRQILFKAARDLRKVAALVLDDVTTEAEINNIQTLQWAKRLAAIHARQSVEIEDLGYEIGTYLGPQREALQRRSRQDYGDAVRRFEQRVEAIGGKEQLIAINSYRPLDN